MVMKEHDSETIEDEDSEEIISIEEAILMAADTLSQRKKAGSECRKSQPSSSSPMQTSTPSGTEDSPTSGCLLGGLPCLWCQKDGPPLPVGDVGVQHMKCPAIYDTQADISDPLRLHEQPSSILQRLEYALSQEDAMPPTAGDSSIGHCSGKDLPPVLYRWSNTDSMGINSREMIRAGLFAQDMDGLPENIPEESFLEYFKLHVTKAESLSPLISSSHRPLAPIHRALRNRKEASIFVIDTSKLTNKVFKAALLVDKTDTATFSWRGYGEYLIWKEVPGTAIACTFTITELEGIVSEHPDIGGYLQLLRIQDRRCCDLSLYKDLAKDMPESDDGYADLLERLTELLGVPDMLRRAVAGDFKKAWTTKFEGLENRPRVEVSRSNPNENEWLASHVHSPTIIPKAATPSEVSYAPLSDDSDSDGDSNKSLTSFGADRMISEEIEAPCPRYDTSEEPYSTHDYSSSECTEERHADDLSMDEGDPMEMGSEDSWPVDEERYIDQSSGSPSISFAFHHLHVEE
ncbi:hypothetical protein PENDEC_c002G01267 [Penicillium decumbens]|uniref:DUF7587 domain-containing protein n=1 Tax=Penicillium decumbens TaxID=69771 RepID=A0A1V6PMQ9_PENDC|nr:hypothetical protein PENDEC_c002G01267 [Penicillium decumbens]